jgi:hypothetical protein
MRNESHGNSELIHMLRKQIAFHIEELSRLYAEYYAAIRAGKAQGQAKFGLAQTSGAFIARPSH